MRWRWRYISYIFPETSAVESGIDTLSRFSRSPGLPRHSSWCWWLYVSWIFCWFLVVFVSTFQQNAVGSEGFGKVQAEGFRWEAEVPARLQTKLRKRFWKLLEKVVYKRTYPCWKMKDKMMRVKLCFVSLTKGTSPLQKRRVRKCSGLELMHSFT